MQESQLPLGALGCPEIPIPYVGQIHWAGFHVFGTWASFRLVVDLTYSRMNNIRERTHGQLGNLRSMDPPGAKGCLLRVASFNVNGIRARMPVLLEWLKRARPHLLALQETKVSDPEFPREPLERAGYFCAFCGEKGFNGVAVLSLGPIEVLQEGLNDAGPADRSRLILARTLGLKVLNTYVPQGTCVGSERFLYKLNWLERLLPFMETHLSPQQPALWLGDFNVAPESLDVYDPAALEGEVGFHPEERAALQRLRYWGWVDVFRLHVKQAGHYTFWDYRLKNAVSRGLGWRVDHIWATEPLSRLSCRAWIDLEPRKAPRPSDHTPIVAEFNWELPPSTVLPSNGVAFGPEIPGPCRE